MGKYFLTSTILVKIYFQNTWMATITNDRQMQVIVFGVNILSFIITYVSIGKTVCDTPNPISLEDQSWPVSPTICLAAIQKHMPMGTAKIKLVVMGLSCHHSQTN